MTIIIQSFPPSKVIVAKSLMQGKEGQVIIAHVMISDI